MKDFVFYDTCCICVDDLCDFYLTTFGKTKRKLQLNLIYPTTTRFFVFLDEESAEEFFFALVKYVDAEPLDVFNTVEEKIDSSSNLVKFDKDKT